VSWIPSHDSLKDHPKRKRLSRLLEISQYEAIGILHCLWWWALDYAPDGDLARFDPADIGDGIDYQGDPKELLNSLASAGFLDGLVIHDWSEYGEALFRRRQANAERQRRYRARYVTDTCKTRNGDVTGERTDRQTEETLPTESVSDGCRKGSVAREVAPPKGGRNSRRSKAEDNGDGGEIPRRVLTKHEQSGVAQARTLVKANRDAEAQELAGELWVEVMLGV
jgi:hypothetical protein